jgi:hypothetical protein
VRSGSPPRLCARARSPCLRIGSEPKKLGSIFSFQSGPGKDSVRSTPPTACDRAQSTKFESGPRVMANGCHLDRGTAPFLYSVGGSAEDRAEAGQQERERTAISLVSSPRPPIGKYTISGPVLIFAAGLEVQGAQIAR